MMTFDLTPEQKAQNEVFFKNVLLTLGEGEEFYFEITNERLTKRNGQLVVKVKETWECLEGVLSQEFLYEHFSFEL